MIIGGNYYIIIKRPFLVLNAKLLYSIDTKYKEAVSFLIGHSFFFMLHLINKKLFTYLF